MRRATRRSDERGAVMVLATFGVVLAMISAALAVDLGRLAQDKRVDQKVADLAALDASRDLAQACARAKVSVARNGFDPNGLVCSDPATNATNDVVIGTWSGGTFTAAATGDAVKVTARSPFKPAFPFVGGVDGTEAEAVASTASQAAFSVGSSLAELDVQKSMLDRLFGRFLDLPAGELSAVSYEGLAGAHVSLLALRRELLDLGYAVGTPTQLLSTSVTVADLLKATAAALEAQNDETAALEVNDFPIASIAATNTVTLGSLFNLAQPGSSSALETQVNVFELIRGAASVANGTNFVDTGIALDNVAGLYDVGVALRVIERAQTAHGPVGVTARNSQVVLRLNIEAIAGLADVVVDVTAADAQATLTAIRCGANPGITLGLTTSGATIGGSAQATPAITLTIAGTIAGTTSPAQEFDHAGEFAPPVGSAEPRHLGASSLDLTPASLTVTGGGALQLATRSSLQAELSVLLPALGPVLSPLLQPTLSALGLEVAGAHVSALDIFPPPPSCGQPHLVG